VASKHKSAPCFLKKGFFGGIKSFKEFEARVGKLADTVEMGDALEILVEAHLHLDEVMKAKDVWVVGSIPQNIRKTLNLPNDSKGIDGVYEDQAGNYIPYQVKYRTDMDTLPYGEISAFLGITEKSLQDRMIFTNARKLSVDVANRTGVRSFRADKFNELTEADFRRIYDWLSDKKVEPGKPWDPLPHQKKAIEKITEGLKEADRTTAVMACGTGKTLVALWAAEAQDPKTVLVLVPSLALLSQTLPDWCKQTSWGERFRYLCVCSDASVDRSAKEDGYALRQQDLEFSVTTDPNVVKGFLADNKSGVNVIFSTYQSAEVVAEGLKEQTVDLGIFDEAHKTTGPKEGLFAFGLSDKNIRIKKRLFLTATPRHYKLNKRDKEGDFQVVSMNDEAVYGKVSYRLPFSTAVAAGIIVPYKVIISVSLNKEVDAELLRRGSTRVRRDEIQAKWVANQIALKRAIEKTGASKIITFHSRVSLAEDFAGDDARGFKEHVKGFDVFHVNGSQNAADRKALLEGFKAAPKGLITNARCLTEGVDVPAVDMVAFVDPRKSKIDIAQAAGRAMRQSKATNKKLGYIVVPLFIEHKKGETEAEAFTRTGFDEVAEVLAAMLESDDDLVDSIKEMQEARGRGDKFNPRRLNEKVQVIGPAINLDELTRSIDVEILERLGTNWDRQLGRLQKFHKAHGHCRVAEDLVVDGVMLGRWVSYQRSRKAQLTADQVMRLNTLGFSWNPVTEKWGEAFNALLKFRKRTGHCRVPRNHKLDGVKLGSWVGTIRQNRDQLTPERERKLDSIGFSWDPVTEQWEEAFNLLRQFHQREGHCRVAQSHNVKGFKLGTWVSNLRNRKDRLTKIQIARLESIGFSWDPFTEQWEEAFASLHEFHKREGHCRVTKNHKVNKLSLGAWVNNQRTKKNELTPDQVRRLESINFSWDPRAEQWEQAFAALLDFNEREGHCRVAKNHKVNNLPLGAWVHNQRTKKNELTPDQVRRLESVNFSWDPRAEQWEQAFAALKEFHDREGHCRVPAHYTSNGIKIEQWIRNMRSRRDQLSTYQIQCLKSVDFSWDPREDQWELSFAALKKFRDREGHCRVAARLVQDGLKLGSWVSKQRLTKTLLTPARISRLNALGFSWDPLTDTWEESFAALEAFQKRTGHCRISKKNSGEEGLKLSAWASDQRHKRTQLTQDQIRRLDALGFSWNPLFDQWEEAFSALQLFHKRKGHCRVRSDFVVDGIKLGGWVNRQRQNNKHLTLNQVKRLDALGFSWDPHADLWEESYESLLDFHCREKNCNVPLGFVVNGLNLGSWVNNQRHKRSRLSTNQISRLERLGFIWKPIEAKWNIAFSALQLFHGREGHCRVPQTHVEGKVKLGAWIHRQRQSKSRLTPDKVARLNSIGFVWKIQSP
jgi:superfamily II DNA or RNA helicase